MNVKLSLVLPSYGRRELTERAIRSVAAQAFDGAEVFFYGDGCPVYRELIAQDWFKELCVLVSPRIRIWTHCHETRDGTPTRIINEALARARGEYFIFMANDDRIAPNHFSNYYNFAKGNDADLTATNSYIEPGLSQRDTRWEYGCVGHSEICVRTELAQRVPAHHRGYGHDWDFICAVKAAARPDKVFKSPHAPTYYVNMGPREHVYQNGTL